MQNLLKNRNFLLLWFAQVFSSLGDTLYTVGVIVKVFEQTGSALQATGVLIATSLPTFLLGPFAGALVDRYSRRRILIIVNLLRAGLVALLPFFVSQGGLNLWGVYFVAAGLSTATIFFQPARMAIVPSIVGRFDLVRANSVLIGTTQAAMAVGFMIGGFLALRLSFQAFIWLEIGLFLSAASLVTMLRFPRKRPSEVETQEKPEPMLRAIKTGFQTIRNNAVARPLIVMEIMEHVPHGIWTSALLLVFVKEALNADADAWGTISGIYFGGMLLGAVIASLMAKRLEQKPGWVIIINAFLSGVLTLCFSVSPSVWLAAILGFCFGPPMAIRDVTQDSLLQIVIDERILGRVYALRETFRVLVFMFSGLFFAWLADSVNIRSIYLIGGGLYLLTAIYAYTNRALRESHIDAEATIPPLENPSETTPH